MRRRGSFLDYYSQALVPSQLENLPDTDHGLDAVRATLKRMVALARKHSKSDIGCINVARQVLMEYGIRDVRRERVESVTALQHFVRDGIAYVPDPNDIEMIQEPSQTLTIGCGDCDDQAILLATLLESVGFATRYIAVGGWGVAWGCDLSEYLSGWGDWTRIPDPPYSHVLTQVKLSNMWVCLETIVEGAEPGWCPKGIRVLMPAHISRG